MKLVLTAKQIKDLADFVEKDGQPSYTITEGYFPPQEGIEEYTGLVAYSASEEHGVLQLK
ncbi:hypothetical protein [Budvicia aquatica]|uniref:Uncharacterized protein n=1 Tax=Budvicia aquatica TaxID=82979 RepID=A0A2C6DIX7_9GAMM|nr:hypothetical protein [Budvicia aquatica]PHI31176.1 hypothetical protein CRN84_18435 [Budvicia aquatica]VFS51436.1 Uncharacterised protein [Budvicia aquatica]